MVKVIKVKVGITPISYNSFKMAIEQDEEEILKYKVFDTINGRVLLGYYFNGVRLVLQFDNKKYLIVFIGEKKIDWEIQDSNVDLYGFQSSEDIIFEYPSGRQEIWRWKEILDSCINRKVAFSPGSQYLFFYSEDNTEYIFNYLIELDKPNKRFLIIDEA